ncbi:MAG: hypothetical protein ACPGSN_02590 [Psychrobium sp.]
MVQYVYNDSPFGSVLTYANEDYFSDKFDLYVYPVLKVNLGGESDLLTQESKNMETKLIPWKTIRME